MMCDKPCEDLGILEEACDAEDGFLGNSTILKIQTGMPIWKKVTPQMMMSLTWSVRTTHHRMQGRFLHVIEKAF